MTACVQLVTHSREMLTNGGANLGSGAAGIVHRFLSDATALYGGFCMAMANTASWQNVPVSTICLAFHVLSRGHRVRLSMFTRTRPLRPSWVDDQGYS